MKRLRPRFGGSGKAVAVFNRRELYRLLIDGTAWPSMASKRASLGGIEMLYRQLGPMRRIAVNPEAVTEGRGRDFLPLSWVYPPRPLTNLIVFKIQRRNCCSSVSVT